MDCAAPTHCAIDRSTAVVPSLFSVRTPFRNAAAPPALEVEKSTSTVTSTSQSTLGVKVTPALLFATEVNGPASTPMKVSVAAVCASFVMVSSALQRVVLQDHVRPLERGAGAAR